MNKTLMILLRANKRLIRLGYETSLEIKTKGNYFLHVFSKEPKLIDSFDIDYRFGAEKELKRLNKFVKEAKAC